MFNNPNAEPEPAEETIEEKIARLALRNGKREALGPDLTTEPNQATAQETSEAKNDADFKYKVDMAKSSAYLRHPELKDLIKALVVIPDGPLADAGKNQIGMTPFVHRYIDRSEWIQYISDVSDQE